MSANALSAIPGYRVEKVLARGGMAAVYRAFDLAQNRVVALKQILPDVASDPEFLSRFRHEVEIHSKLRHRNILTLYDYGAGPETYFIAMEYVDGGALRELMDRTPKQRPETALFVAREIYQGLASAHEQGIVHRDMKPQNVLVTRGGAVKVADFGISKTSQMTRLTQTGNVVGTPAYMSPEQAMARPLDRRSDVFSVGVMLYEMLAGKNPFLTDNPATTLRMIVDHRPRPLSEEDPTIPVEVEMLVERLMEKSPERRTQDAALAARALDERIAALGVAQPEEAFRQFLADPAAYVAGRNAALSRAHLHRARTLHASGTASFEVILWEAVQAYLLDAKNEEAGTLVTQLTKASGYRFQTGAGHRRTRELGARLAEDPDNVSVLLQLAKAAKMERDYLQMMRLFFRLRSLPVADTYLQGQIAALVARREARTEGGTDSPAPGLQRSDALRPPERALPVPTVPLRAGVAAPARPSPPAASPLPGGDTTSIAGRLERRGVPLPILIGAAAAALSILAGLLALIFP